MAIIWKKVVFDFLTYSCSSMPIQRSINQAYLDHTVSHVVVLKTFQLQLKDWREINEKNPFLGILQPELVCLILVFPLHLLDFHILIKWIINIFATLYVQLQVCQRLLHILLKWNLAAYGRSTKPDHDKPHAQCCLGTTLESIKSEEVYHNRTPSEWT